MAKDYTKPANTALKLIKKFGGPAELIKQEGEEVDPTDSTEGTEEDPVSYPTTAVFLPIGKNDVVYMPNGTAEEGSQKVLMEAVNLTVDPEVSDTVKYRGEEWQIISIKPLKPSEVNVLWTLFVNR
jgi:hypothetical protein